MSKYPDWTTPEVSDLREIAADQTLTWDEVAAALVRRNPGNRPVRSATAVRVCASKNRMPVRTLDDGTPLRPPRPVLPDDARSMLDAALDKAREEGRADILDALREVIHQFGAGK